MFYDLGVLFGQVGGLSGVFFQLKQAGVDEVVVEWFTGGRRWWLRIGGRRR